MKKIICIVLTLVLSLSLSLSVLGATESETLETAEQSQELIENVVNEVTEINDENASNNLENISDNIEAVITDLNILVESNPESKEQAEEIANSIETINSKINTLNSNLESLEEPVENGTTESNNAINSAKIANSSNDKITAEAAKSNAENELSKAESDLVQVTEVYNKAESEVKTLQSEYNTLIQEKQVLEKQIEELNSALNDAKTNSTAALEALKATQTRLNTLDQEASDLKSQEEDLKSIQEQYYAMMIYYYRDLLGNNIVYDSEGHLDIEANAKLAEENGSAESKANDPNKTFIMFCLNLMEQLIKFKLANQANVDIQSIQIAQEGKDKKDSAEGEVFINNKGQDQTKVGNKTIQLWDNQTGVNGRNNHVKVVYKDTDGNEHIEYYNYIYKSAKYQEELELEKGPVYLALVKQDKEGKWQYAEDFSCKNYYDYAELTKTINAINDLVDYTKAKEAVSAAKTKVETLQTQLNSLTLAGIDDERLTVLKNKLDQALIDLNKAENDKKDLEEIVKKARAAVAGIDLSRFDIDDSDDDYTPSSSIPSSDIVLTTALPTVAIPMVASVVNNTNIITDNEDLLVRDLGNFINLEDEKLPAADKITTLLEENDPLPGSQSVDTEIEQNNSIFWWIILILIILALILLIYAIHKAKSSSNE